MIYKSFLIDNRLTGIKKMSPEKAVYLFKKLKSKIILWLNKEKEFTFFDFMHYYNLDLSCGDIDFAGFCAMMDTTPSEMAEIQDIIEKED